MYFLPNEFFKVMNSNQIFSKNLLSKFSRNLVVFNLVEQVSLLLKTLFILKIQDTSTTLVTL